MTVTYPMMLACAAALLGQQMGTVAVKERTMMWIKADPAEKDDYVAFRGHFELDRPTEVEIRTLGASWFIAWLDEKYLTEGPNRFPTQYPEYDSVRVSLPAGRHLLAVQVHHVGETTRMMPNLPPFLFAEIRTGNESVPVRWHCTRLVGYQSQVRRINPILSWIEWCDTRQNPAGWRLFEFDDASWSRPVDASPPIGELAPPSIGPVLQFRHELKPVEQGPLAATFGYERDDIPARFFLRDLTCKELPVKGEWRRYDLGRVRLFRPHFVLDVPEGTIVEFAYTEALSHGRVAPYIPLSTGPSCNLDHYVARGGPQTFSPLTPRGGRHLEVHVLAPPDQIRFMEEVAIERTYHDEPEGWFRCDDPLLNRIWKTGIDTYRACTEDAVVDNPTRERGQWTGDVVSVGMDIAAVGYSDLRLFRRGLVQSAQCARKDGLIAGLCPGTVEYLATYAAQWVNACVHYYELSDDRSLLTELYPAAKRNLAVFERYVTDKGLIDGVGWSFVDWGYVRSDGPADMAYNMHYIAALRAMCRWCDLEHSDDRVTYEKTQQHIEATVRQWLKDNPIDGQAGWEKIGYHCTALAMWLGLIDASQQPAAIEALKRHLLRCFPNDPTAPRLGAPDQNNRRLITPYFAHYAFVPLIENGEMDFVLDQYRKCWGWMLEDGRTTWIEVFDTRWTHCHQWSGAPTWQLSRYVLGLQPRLDLGAFHYVLRLRPGSLRQAEGGLPLPDGSGTIRVRWTRGPQGVHYVLRSPRPIHLHLPGVNGEQERVVRVDDRIEFGLDETGTHDWKFKAE